jgi:hypothetical protein
MFFIILESTDSWGIINGSILETPNFSAVLANKIKKFHINLYPISGGALNLGFSGHGLLLIKADSPRLS